MLSFSVSDLIRTGFWIKNTLIIITSPFLYFSWLMALLIDKQNTKLDLVCLLQKHFFQQNAARDVK